MNYKTFEYDNYRIHFCKQKKFKTVEFRIYFCSEVNRKKMTYHSVLMDMLVFGSKKYPTKRELLKKTQELYSIYISSSARRHGNLLMNHVGVSFLNPKYTDSNMLSESMEILNEILFNPLISENSFNEKYLEIIKKECWNETEKIKENPKLYANIKTLEYSNPNANYAITGYCDQDVLKEINGNNLYLEYLKMMNETQKEIIVVGDLSEDELISMIKKYFPFQKQKKYLFEKQNVSDILDNFREKQETMPFTQSKLSILVKFDYLSEFEYYYAMNVYNMLLGGCSESLLMKNIRENNSLAYYANTFLSKFDNILFINSGIDYHNYSQTLELVQKTLDDIKEGHFNNKLLTSCKKEFLSMLRCTNDSINDICDIILGQVVFNSKSLKERIKMINCVKKEDIIKIANKMHLDTVFLLKGEL